MKVKNSLENFHVDGRIILKLILYYIDIIYHLNIISIKTNIIFIVVIINISILHYCCCYFVKLHISKTRVIDFTRKTKVLYYTYKIWDSYITCRDTIKGLGVQLVQNCNSMHMQTTLSPSLSGCWA
jgi:hypothetical protein